MKYLFKITIFIFLISNVLSCQSNEWIPLFDGKSLNGWSAAENQDTWQVKDGALVTSGIRSHLFYTGDVNNHNFKNFELVLDVKTTPGSNSGIYIHTEYQESGWPAKGYECQVINSSPKTKPGQYVERKMTGSLYAVRNIWKSPVKDNEWFNYRIVVEGKTIRTYINDELMVDYTEPDDIFRRDDKKERILTSGTFALQGHDPGSVVYYKNIKVKPLQDDLSTPGIPAEDLGFEKKIVTLSDINFPLMDLHVHLKGDLTLDQAMENARKYGFTYGIAVNCGLKMGFETDDEINDFLNNYKKLPQTYLAIQAEGREWLDMFSNETIDKFDYVFTDAMTWTNENGKRMRLWIKEETEVGDPENFMDQLVNRIEKIIENEPIDIYVNATYLPDEIDERYDELWTSERMDRVINSLVNKGVALEINDRYKIPSPGFIKRAKEEGVKFTFGTNNTGSSDLGKLEYCIEMVEECNLSWRDMWIPSEY